MLARGREEQEAKRDIQTIQQDLQTIDLTSGLSDLSSDAFNRVRFRQFVRQFIRFKPSRKSNPTTGTDC